MLLAVLAVTLGAAALWLGGEQFVLGSSRLAERTRMPLVLVGMVVAGFGTSAPEISVSVLSATRGEGALAVGNALGSNVANVFLVLPVAALATAWVPGAEILRREIWAVLGGSALVAALSIDGEVTRAEGALLVVAFAVLLAWLAISAVRSPSRAVVEAEIGDIVGPPPERRAIPRESLRTLVGLTIVILSADRVVWGAVTLARGLGISEATIGLTVVPLGTSLPEAVTATIAARRGEPDLALGNVLGSNLFNALLIVGVAGLIAPLPLPGETRFVAPVATVVAAAALLLFLRRGYRITRPQAVVALASYAAFIAVLYVAR